MRPNSCPPTTVRLAMRKAIRSRLLVIKGLGQYEEGQLRDALAWLDGKSIGRDMRIEIVQRAAHGWVYRLHAGSLGYSAGPTPLIAIKPNGASVK